MTMSNGYAVLSPWAERNQVPLKGISPRLDTLAGKTIGLFSNFKDAGRKISEVLEIRLKEKFPDITIINWINDNLGLDETTGPRKEDFRNWIDSIDAAVLSVCD